MEVFDGLIEKYKGELQKGAFLPIRRGLEKSKRETEQALNIRKVGRARADHARGAWQAREELAAEERWLSGRRAGPGKSLSARAALDGTAQNDPAPRIIMNWRKRVKDHWYHMRLLESLWTDVMQAHEGSLKNLETWLGDDHNLVVLWSKLEDKAGQYGEEKEVQLFLALGDQYQRELRENSMSLGQRVYEPKPRQLTRDWSKLWDAWQQQPDSMKEGRTQRDRRLRSNPAVLGLRRRRRLPRLKRDVYRWLASWASTARLNSAERFLGTLSDFHYHAGSVSPA